MYKTTCTTAVKVLPQESWENTWEHFHFQANCNLVEMLWESPKSLNCSCFACCSLSCNPNGPPFAFYATFSTTLRQPQPQRLCEGRPSHQNQQPTYQTTPQTHGRQSRLYEKRKSRLLLLEDFWTDFVGPLQIIVRGIPGIMARKAISSFSGPICNAEIG